MRVIRSWLLALGTRPNRQITKSPSSPDDPITRIQEIFDEENVAVVVDHGTVTGIISKIDVVEFLTSRARVQATANSV